MTTRFCVTSGSHIENRVDTDPPTSSALLFANAMSTEGTVTPVTDLIFALAVIRSFSKVVAEYDKTDTNWPAEP